MTLSEVLSIISISVVIAGGIFSLFQWRHQIKINRSKSIIEMLRETLSGDVNDFIYMIEYGELWYQAGFAGSKKERVVDKALSYFSYICYMYTKKIITDEEFSLEAYSIVRTLNDHQVQNYLFNIYELSKKQKIKEDKGGKLKTYDFCALIDFGIEKEILPKDFKDLGARHRLGYTTEFMDVA